MCNTILVILIKCLISYDLKFIIHSHSTSCFALENHDL